MYVTTFAIATLTATKRITAAADPTETATMSVCPGWSFMVINMQNENNVCNYPVPCLNYMCCVLSLIINSLPIGGLVGFDESVEFRVPSIIVNVVYVDRSSG